MVLDSKSSISSSISFDSSNTDRGLYRLRTRKLFFNTILPLSCGEVVGVAVYCSFPIPFHRHYSIPVPQAWRHHTRCALFRMKIVKCAVVGLQTVWLPLLVCILITSSAVNLVPRLLHSECEMTYMYPPQYQKVNLSRELQLSFPQYSLHLYRETRSKTESKLDSLPLILNGVPAVFIPGNAGSHKQGTYSI